MFDAELAGVSTTLAVGTTFQEGLVSYANFNLNLFSYNFEFILCLFIMSPFFINFIVINFDTGAT